MAKKLIKVTEGTAVRIKDKELLQSIGRYNDGMNAMTDGAWIVAEAIHDMLTGKQWKNDFDSERKFCEALDVKQSTWNQMKNAVDFRNEHPSITKGMTPNWVYILSTTEEPEALIAWAKETNTPINSDGKLKAAKNAFKNKDAIEADYTATDVEESEETETEAESEKEPEIVAIKYKGKTYEIPWKVLTKYEVKQ